MVLVIFYWRPQKISQGYLRPRHIHHPEDRPARLVASGPPFKGGLVAADGDKKKTRKMGHQWTCKRLDSNKRNEEFHHAICIRYIYIPCGKEWYGKSMVSQGNELRWVFMEHHVYVDLREGNHPFWRGLIIKCASGPVFFLPIPAPHYICRKAANAQILWEAR